MFGFITGRFVWQRANTQNLPSTKISLRWSNDLIYFVDKTKHSSQGYAHLDDCNLPTYKFLLFSCKHGIDEHYHMWP